MSNRSVVDNAQVTLKQSSTRCERPSLYWTTALKYSTRGCACAFIISTDPQVI